MSPENRALMHKTGDAGYVAVFLRNGLLPALNRLLDAVRAEERARAVEVVRPFADVADAFEDESWAEDDAVSIECQDWVVDNTKITVADLRRAAAYISDSEEGA